MKFRTAILMIVVALAAAGHAQQPPQLINAHVKSLPPGSDLQKNVESLVRGQKTTAWIGYSVPAIPKPRFICCFQDSAQFEKLKGCCSGCHLEGRDSSYYNSTGGTCVPHAPAHEIYVLLRAEKGEVIRFRTATPDCGLDAGGLDFYWLGDVKPQDSLRLLAAMIQGNQEGSGQTHKHRSNEEILGAIALHDDPMADEMLKRFAGEGNSEHLREQSLFWLGNERGRKGFEIVRDFARRDPDDRVRKHATFALSQSGENEAIDELIRMAKTDHASQVRAQALFWLAQRAGKKAESAITEAMENDPEVEVKKKAVFALSQMAGGEGVPRLIQVASGHKNAILRKEAIFWLGESGDPRALAFLEDFVKR